jgi:hypothetical protein
LEELDPKAEEAKPLMDAKDAAMAKLRDAQAEIAKGLGREETDGLRAQAGRVKNAVRANGLPDAGLRDRMDRVKKELDELADNELPGIDEQLTQMDKQAAKELADKAALRRNRELLKKEADEKEKRAAGLEDEARAAADPARKQQAREEADRLRAEARQARQDAKAPGEKLVELQDAVEKKLTALLQRLEPWSDALEVKGEAGRLLQDQQRLQAALQELDRKPLSGRDVDQLKESERAELNGLRDGQERLQQRTEEMVNKIKRMADDRAAKDPAAAEALRKAFDQALQGDVAGRMKNARDEIGANRLNNAAEDQKAAAEELQKMIKGFDERREAGLDELDKKLKEKQKELEELAKEQDELRKKIEQIEKDNKLDDAARGEALKKLAGEQERLRKKAEELAEQLTKLGADEAAQDAADAAAAMKDDAEQLTKGKKPQDDQAAGDHLEDAKDDVAQKRQDTKDQLSREQQARVADALGRLKERLESLTKEAVRLRDGLAQAQGPSRALLRSLGDLRDAQQGLSDETTDLARKELADAPVFLRLVTRSGESMAEAARLFDEGAKADPAAVGDAAVAAQKDAAHRLALVIDALKNEDHALPPKGAQAGGPPPGGPGSDQQPGGPGGQGNGLPPPAQLKVLKAMEVEVKGRTDAFGKVHDDPAKYSDADKAELQDIRKAQQEVSELLEEFRTPPAPGGEREKK